MGFARRGAGLLGVWGVIFGLAAAGRALANDGLERVVLMAMNPDAPLPALDALVVTLTDLSIPCFAVVFTCWWLGYAGRTHGWVPSRLLLPAFLGLGVLIAALVLALQRYELSAVPLLMVLAIVASFALAGSSYAWIPATTQTRLFRMAWMPYLAVGVVELAQLCLEWTTELRVRPLNSDNAAWNGVLRVIADERVRYGTSYVSGHATSFFAMVTPFALTTRSRRVAALLLVWAALHAASRLYVAAHYPLGVAMGSALGFAVAATLVLAARPRPTPAHLGLPAPH